MKKLLAWTKVCLDSWQFPAALSVLFGILGIVSLLNLLRILENYVDFTLYLR